MATAALCVAACSATGPLYEAAAAPTNGQALVYIYRLPNTPFTARRASFWLDDVRVAELNQSGYTRFYAPEGSHTLSQRWPWDVAGGKTTYLGVRWQAGKTYYYNLESSLDFRGLGETVTWRISAIDPLRASREITAYHYQPPLGTDQLH